MAEGRTDTRARFWNRGDIEGMTGTCQGPFEKLSGSFCVENETKLEFSAWLAKKILYAPIDS
jgi:hypothetical protein